MVVALTSWQEMEFEVGKPQAEGRAYESECHEILWSIKMQKIIIKKVINK